MSSSFSGEEEILPDRKPKGRRLRGHHVGAILTLAALCAFFVFILVLVAEHGYSRKGANVQSGTLSASSVVIQSTTTQTPYLGPSSVTAVTGDSCTLAVPSYGSTISVTLMLDGKSVKVDPGVQAGQKVTLDLTAVDTTAGSCTVDISTNYSFGN